MENTEEITALINQIYDADIESIRNLSKLANDLTNSNKLVVPGGLDIEGSFNLLPKGCIVAWNGTQADDGTVAAPEGWALCDGTNETPDLRGRFIRMATTGLDMLEDVHTYTVTNREQVKQYNSQKRDAVDAFIIKHKFNDKGGSDYRTITTDELPRHNHGMDSDGAHTHKLEGPDDYLLFKKIKRSKDGSSKWTGTEDYKSLNDGVFKAKSAGDHKHKITETGRGKEFGLSSPYYVLVYIMKL